MPIPDINAIPAGTQLVITSKFKDYEGGTVVNLERVIPVQGKPMAMVAVPGARPFAIDPTLLDVAGGAAPAPAVVQEDDGISGPVMDLLIQVAPMDNQFMLNFAGAYIQTFGREDVSFLSEMLAAAGIPVGQTLTVQQAAKIADEFYNTFGIPVDPFVTAALNAAPAVQVAAPVVPPQPVQAAVVPGVPPAPVVPQVQIPAAPVVTPAAQVAAAPAPTAEEAPAKRTRAKKGETPKVGRVDKETWTPGRIDALRLAGVMMPIYAENPDGFDDVLDMAVKMLQAADRVRE